jgi:hypothetical protein
MLDRAGFSRQPYSGTTILPGRIELWPEARKASDARTIRLLQQCARSGSRSVRSQNHLTNLQRTLMLERSSTKTPLPWRWAGLEASEGGKRGPRSLAPINVARSHAELRLRGGKMTAEVVVINKSAAALAADSAVTIDSGGTEKIYNSVDKIFELNERHPVGLMINGGLEFMGIPLATVVKLYRSKRQGVPQSTVVDYAADFLSYLATEISISDEEMKSHVWRLLFSAYRDIWQEITDSGRRLFTAAPKFSRPKFHNDVLLPILESHIDKLTRRQSLGHVDEFHQDHNARKADD